jgi:hypothetical protein
MSSDDRSSFERPLEALVFAPLGFALEVRQMYPRFVDRGRNQILLARLVGRYATRQAMTAAGGVLERNGGPATDVLRLVGLVPPAGDDGGVEVGVAIEEVAGEVAKVVGDDTRPTTPDHLVVVPDGVDDGPAGDGPAGDGPAGDVPADDGPAGDGPADVGPVVDVVVPDPASLAIPDYDSLAASQVVPRLDALDVDELEAVRCYESGVRGRKTILAKIAQLQAG